MGLGINYHKIKATKIKILVALGFLEGCMAHGEWVNLFAFWRISK